LAGTASRADRFVLIEHPGPWPGKAVEAFGPDVRAALTSVPGIKVLLMRRPNRADRPAGVRRWAFADARARRITWGKWDDEADLTRIADVAEADPDGWSHEPVILVCTHARHDACCGVLGKPVVTALAERFGDSVWTCSHVGRHRFAGNVVLPLDGTYYGRMHAADAVGVIERHRAGDVAVEQLRGFSWLSPPAQLVAAEAHRRWGPASADDVTGAEISEIARGRWRVELTGSQTLPSLITAEVQERPTEPILLSCGAEPEPTTTYAIVSMDAA
jgi:hypothetical protein